MTCLFFAYAFYPFDGNVRLSGTHKFLRRNKLNLGRLCGRKVCVQACVVDWKTKYYALHLYVNKIEDTVMFTSKTLHIIFIFS